MAELTRKPQLADWTANNSDFLGGAELLRLLKTFLRGADGKGQEVGVGRWIAKPREVLQGSLEVSRTGGTRGVGVPVWWGLHKSMHIAARGFLFLCLCAGLLLRIPQD